MFGKKSIKKRVLVVEDDALLAKILVEKHEREGFLVSVVENGLEVADTVKSFSPNLIILDLIIPGIDGFAVLKQLKANTATEKIPVVILSNLGDEGDIRSGKALGAEEYFIKSNVEVKKIVDFVKKRLGV
ncbi:hypothetical protein A2348_01410 [Candidatus Uhrbacteria bacterium RIFOXYB12_FULL_58_10]|uniref:Response regulatory domain-containing protein n=1 Tax=Candidatus Uhrbacteria bacterium RIFOXYB2_FULL_57_15 TaxID=1802422 RepID=A0A1F7W5L7_9BACT|nr:MAG: hypothetical protein A2348_01410 [Candidatus Uhrbacteria bacterium RIFOXYB12_FULL_58_10]OGL98040.1 MAG: hypothetical protein A2304_00840 [Candidatus Uhrbacteria bacterium RIFOXYB2_FULL_57_15]OGL99288.1 MAG: hypothetical protein A2501_03950 [Candidatus Uhrbacteria bacterium RIFOXYC12_FULL_57_11]